MFGLASLNYLNLMNKNLVTPVNIRRERVDSERTTTQSNWKKLLRWKETILIQMTIYFITPMFCLWKGIQLLNLQWPSKYPDLTLLAFLWDYIKSRAFMLWSNSTDKLKESLRHAISLMFIQENRTWQHLALYRKLQNGLKERLRNPSTPPFGYPYYQQNITTQSFWSRRNTKRCSQKSYQERKPTREIFNGVEIQESD